MLNSNATEVFPSRLLQRNLDASVLCAQHSITSARHASKPGRLWSLQIQIAPKSSPMATNFAAWGPHAPPRVAVGARADGFFRVIYGSYRSIQAQRDR
jgi:hypothetical protein